MKFHVWCNGDMSVGIPGSYVEVDWPHLNEEDNKEFIKFVKDNLLTTFQDIFDDRHTYVLTDKEYEKYTKEDEYE